MMPLWPPCLFIHLCVHMQVQIVPVPAMKTFWGGNKLVQAQSILAHAAGGYQRQAPATGGIHTPVSYRSRNNWETYLGLCPVRMIGLMGKMASVIHSCGFRRKYPNKDLRQALDLQFKLKH